MAIFAEGTRFTEAKLQSSREYAQSKGLPELKYHLLPRPRGLSITLHQFKDTGRKQTDRSTDRGREGGREGGKGGRREGGREGRREGERKGRKEGGRERGWD